MKTKNMAVLVSMVFVTGLVAPTTGWAIDWNSLLNRDKEIRGGEITENKGTDRIDAIDPTKIDTADCGKAKVSYVGARLCDDVDGSNSSVYAEMVVGYRIKSMKFDLDAASSTKNVECHALLDKYVAETAIREKEYTDKYHANFAKAKGMGTTCQSTGMVVVNAEKGVCGSCGGWPKGFFKEDDRDDEFGSISREKCSFPWSLGDYSSGN